MSEWLLQEAVQLVVRGYEVNRSWWEGNNSVPHFIDITYCDELEDKTCSLPSHSALMFCYFNNLHYFHSYLEQYQGDTSFSFSSLLTLLVPPGPCVILIGPCSEASRHCEPEPLYLSNMEGWRVQSKLRYLSVILYLISCSFMDPILIIYFICQSI